MVYSSLPRVQAWNTQILPIDDAKSQMGSTKPTRDQELPIAKKSYVRQMRTCKRCLNCSAYNRGRRYPKHSILRDNRRKARLPSLLP
jgi:hypothetical protein